MIICQLCEAIDYIHKQNILHLDVKVSAGLVLNSREDRGTKKKAQEMSKVLRISPENSWQQTPTASVFAADMRSFGDKKKKNEFSVNMRWDLWAEEDDRQGQSWNQQETCEKFKGK